MVKNEYDGYEVEEFSQAEINTLKGKIMLAKYFTWPARKAAAKLCPSLLDPYSISVDESIAGFANIDEFLY